MYCFSFKKIKIIVFLGLVVGLDACGPREVKDDQENLLVSNKQAFVEDSSAMLYGNHNIVLLEDNNSMVDTSHRTFFPENVPLLLEEMPNRADVNIPKKAKITPPEKAKTTPPKKVKSSNQSEKKKQIAKKINKYQKFTTQENYPRTFSVYEDPVLLKKSTSANTSIKVNIAKQRLKLLIDGKVALDTPTTTGSDKKKDHNTGEIKDKSTPVGSFRIIEKREQKNSNIFGKLYLKDKEVYSGDHREFKGKFDKFEGVPVNYWLRLTNDGIGIHASNGIRRQPFSNGCIRVPSKVAPKIFAKVNTSTTVTVE